MTSPSDKSMPRSKYIYIHNTSSADMYVFVFDSDDAAAEKYLTLAREINAALKNKVLFLCVFVLVLCFLIFLTCDVTAVAKMF